MAELLGGVESESDWVIAVRHGQSAANAAYEQAALNNTGIVLPWRDADVPLSDLGARQAVELGQWVASQSSDKRPNAVWCSPYKRALDTWQIASGELKHSSRLKIEVRVDTRLQDRNKGDLGMMSLQAARERYPTEVHQRDKIGKYAYRPPNGESLVDMSSRIHQVAEDLFNTEKPRRIMIVSHDAVITLLRLALKHEKYADVAQIATYGPVPNASITSWKGEGKRLDLVNFASTSHLHSSSLP